MSRSDAAPESGPALEQREQFPSYQPEHGVGANVQSSSENKGLSEASSPTAYTSSHPATPPPINLTAAHPSDAAADSKYLHPATLAQKLAAHEASLATSPSSNSSVGAASHRATPGEWTPRSDADWSSASTPPIASAPFTPYIQSRAVSGLAHEQPIEDSSDSSAFSSRVPTLGESVASPPDQPASPGFSPPAQHPADLQFSQLSVAGDKEGKAKDQHKQLAGDAKALEGKPVPKRVVSDVQQQKDRSASPGKPRPAVFSAIPPKDPSHQHYEKRPPMPEKKSMLGKMLDGMRSKDNLHEGVKEEKKSSRPRGKSFLSSSEAESGAESDSGLSTSFKEKAGGIFGRKMSGGKKDKEADKATFLATQGRSASEEGARLGDDLAKRPSQKSEMSLKEYINAAPGLNRKTSVTSKRSDDGKSEKGSQYGDSDSHYEGSKKGASTSLLKKYGACEKVAIGKGATAVVRLAHKWDKSTEKLYAVKEFRKRRKNESEKDYVKKLTSEFCISSTLHHPNIVETVDLVQDESHHWCEVMEYCPNGDLYAAIKRGGMTQKEMVSYFQQMVSGVAYLHSMGVAHRDIKPENLLLDAKNTIKITDFGVSDVFRMCWEKTCHLSKGLCGSEPYIAPEQFEEKAQYDARLVDVWALAVVFYCMQFQELPWRVAKKSDPSYAAFVEAYPNSGSPPPLGDLAPRECRSVIKAMLNPDPKHRYSTDMIMKDKWFSSLLPDDHHSKPKTKMAEQSQALKEALGNER